MKVQKGQLNNGKTIWLVLDDNYLPVEPISKYLRYLDSLERSPNTISGYARNLKLYFEYLKENSLEMINNGVPQHIIQRYLGHESPEMRSVYAHIFDNTLKLEIAKYHDSRVVNVAGEVVESTTPELDNDLDLHLLKKKVLAQSLPNGSCARPIVLGECPHANACFTCGDFRTTIEFLDQHKAQLEEMEKLVKNAEEKGWKRHAEMNTKVRNNLKKIITTLESGSKDIVSGGDE
jgi:integrase/recombinase XerD